MTKEKPEIRTISVWNDTSSWEVIVYYHYYPPKPRTLQEEELEPENEEKEDDENHPPDCFFRTAWKPEEEGGKCKTCHQFTIFSDYEEIGLQLRIFPRSQIWFWSVLDVAMHVEVFRQKIHLYMYLPTNFTLKQGITVYFNPPYEHYEEYTLHLKHLKLSELSNDEQVASAIVKAITRSSVPLSLEDLCNQLSKSKFAIQRALTHLTHHISSTKQHRKSYYSLKKTQED